MVTRERPQSLRRRPRVSVVIPCYNYGHFLPDCVRGVLDQDGVDVDVLIIDDCSPDGSAAVARRIADADPRVSLIAHEVNAGHLATYAEGLNAAGGDYVVLLSADDLVTPGSFQRAAALLEAHPEVVMAHGFAQTFWHELPPPPRTEVRSWSIWPGEEWIGKLSRSGSNPVATPEVMMRTEAMHKLGEYDPRVPHAADFLLWLRAAALGDIGRVNGVDQACYRVHGDNMHVQQFAGADTDLRQRHEAFEIFFDEDGHDLPRAAAWRASSRLAVAREALVVACAVYEGRTTGDTALAARLVAFAEEIHPPARESRLRRRYARLAGRAERGKGPLVPPGITAFDKRVRHHLAWRRRRWSGVESAVRLP